MAGFILCRKSRDEDAEHESLHMQRDLVREYVHKVGDTIIDEVLEDNISGTLFDRPGIKRMYELADAKMIDTVYIKDLSRLSLDRFYTLLIVKDMKERNVRIVSVTEGIDSFNRSDDLIIGFKGLINDSYVQDIIVKILAALRHKQEFEGIVINVPMGYLKDRYTKKVEICEETADIIRRIYKLFLDGHGTETIAKILNQEGVKTPAYYELKLKGKSLGDNKPKATFEYLWTYSIVRRILTNPFYCGDLVNHQRERSRITKKQIKVPKEEQFIHKDAVPAIIPREIWDKVQEIIRINSEGKVKSQSNQTCHRYASLLKCGDCGSTFTAKRRKTKDKPDRIEYVCNGYHRHTHMVCSSHRINESVLDEQIYKQLAIMRDGLSKCSRQIESDIRSWMAQKNNVSKRIKRLQDSINATELEIEQILMEKIKDRDNAERYERMIEKRNREIEGFKNEIAKIENIDKTIKERKKAMLENANLLDKILSEKELSHTNLCLLLEKIIIHEDDYGLRLEIRMKAPFLEKSYTDEIGMIYEDDYEEVSA